MDFKDFTTVGKFCDDRRSKGIKVDDKWFRDRIRNGEIPSIEVGGNVYVRIQHLEDAWPGYQRDSAERRASQGRRAAETRENRLDAIMARLVEIERMLMIVIRNHK